MTVRSMRNGFLLWYGDRRPMVLHVSLAALERRPLDGDAVQRAVLIDRHLVLERQRLPLRILRRSIFTLFTAVGAHCRRLALGPHNEHLGLMLLGRRREAECSY